MSFPRWIKKIISQKNVKSFNQGKLFFSSLCEVADEVIKDMRYITLTLVLFLSYFALREMSLQSNMSEE